jgi:CubicO group peptidase (beta-lactamase class C family)
MVASALVNLVRGKSLTHDLDALVSAYHQQGRFDGAVLVARNQQILLKKGYGLANREYGIANTPQTVFRIGSMTKPFTAIAVMQQVENGKLRLSDTVSRYLPDFPNGERITIHHLLSNTSGIEDFIPMPEYARQMTCPLPTDALIALFRDCPLRFEPGAEYGYSNSNWVLLGVILEQITGQRYADLIHERIFRPAGMTASGYHWTAPLIKPRAQGYVDTGSGVLNAEPVHEDAMYAAGALYSTVEDLYRWDQALNGTALLQPETLAEMTSSVTTTDDSGYGYGWELHQTHGHPWSGHSGGLPGFTANIARFTDDNVTIIVLSNLGSSAWEKINDDLAVVVFGEPYTLPNARQFVQLDTSALIPYTGTFKLTYFGRTADLRFEVENGALTMRVTGLPKTTAFALGHDRFYARSKGEVEFTFIRDSSGAFNRIEAMWSGYLCYAERIS